MSAALSSSPAPGTAVSIGELIAARAEAQRLGLGSPQVLAAGPGGQPARLRGAGVEYAESRVYSPGDDPRSVDWRVTARAAVPHVKVWRQERERPVLLVVDQGPSMRFGTRVAFKSVVAARAAALLAWGASAQGERVGGLVLDGGPPRWCPPRRREAGVLDLLRGLSVAPVAAAPGAGFLARLPGLSGGPALPLPATGLLWLISDFADLHAAPGDWLARLAGRGTLVMLMVYDPIEANGPPAGHWPVTDGRRDLLLDLGSPARRERFTARLSDRLERLSALAGRHGARLLTLATDQPPGPTLARAIAARGPALPGGRPSC